ncbi:MAG: SpoIID/LytB domain-containing protein [Gemmatimonadetes bacterium]|nr:SpoIID/LytB domain-containing protein [Gemmatimonadota bacterium]
MARPRGGGGAEPELRIGLVTGAPKATIGGAGQGEIAAIVDGNPVFRLPAGEVATVRPEGLGIVIEAGTKRWRQERVTFVNLVDDRFVSVNGRPYRGVADVYQRGGAVYVVNRLAVDAYLQGVVSAEMGRRGPDELAALAAQAIVSRTYAIANRGRFGSQGYDLAADITDQAYGGVAAEQPQGLQAVQATKGLVLASGGRPIRAFFHSTCGFATASPEEVFRAIKDETYLRTVSDRKPGGGYYCDISPRFRWRVEWDPATLTGILRRTIPAVLGVAATQIDSVRGLRIAHTGRSGRVTELRVRVGRGEIPVYGPDIRSVLRTPAGDPLGSTAFQLTVREGGAIVASGAGWGHGVGLCQWGAVGRARAGQGYRTIVTTYFPGATIEKWY